MRVNIIILFLSILTIFLFISSIRAQTYSWTDEEGKIRFADDYSKVPEKYKKSAVPVGPTKEQAEKFREMQIECDKEYLKKKDQEGFQSEQSQKSHDMMEEMVRRFPGISYQWTQDMSLWIKVPASFAYHKYELEELAITIANHYHKVKGHMVCVRFYYADGKKIVRECR